MESYQYSLLVRCKGIFEYMVTSPKGTLQLYVDPLFKPGACRVTTGLVVSAPRSMPDWAKIVPEVQSGDTVYFHYNSLDDEALVPDSDGIYEILYDMVFAYVRGGEIHPIAGKVLMQAVPEPSVEFISVNGQDLQVKKTPSGIIRQISVVDDLHKHGTLARSYSKGRITHIATPLIGEPLPDVKIGDVVYYALHADFEITIEGADYFVMDQELLLMVE